MCQDSHLRTLMCVCCDSDHIYRPALSHMSVSDMKRQSVIRGTHNMGSALSDSGGIITTGCVFGLQTSFLSCNHKDLSMETTWRFIIYLEFILFRFSLWSRTNQEN